eukprot:gene462-6873_t
MVLHEGKKFLLYGAYGYTGKLITELAIKRGLKENMIIGGRNEEKVKAHAKKYEIKDIRVFSVDDKDLEKHFEGVHTILHCGGPFIETYKQIVEVCLKKGVHYTDVTGEIDVFEGLSTYHEKAKKKNIFVLPGIGFDVVPSDCLAQKLKEKLPDATEIELAFCPNNSKGSETSRGTTKTMVIGMVHQDLIKYRKDGQIVKSAPEFRTYEVKGINKKRELSLAGWGDVSTAYHSTGVKNIKVFMPVAKNQILFLYYFLFIFMYLPFIQTILLKLVDMFVDGPDVEKVKNLKTHFIGTAKNSKGEKVEIQYAVPSGYPLTADTAVRIVDRILGGKIDESKHGFLTPSLAFGSGFIDECDGFEELQ